MENKELDILVAELTPNERQYLLDRLKSMFLVNSFETVTACPCCVGKNFIKYGMHKNIQKYQCKTTGNIFSAKTKTVVSGIKQVEKFSQLLELMTSNKIPTVREIKKVLSVSIQTAFDWRTKVLTAIYDEVHLENNVVEFDETNFRISRKGRKGMDKRFSRKRGKKLVGDNQYNVKVFMSYSRTTKKLELFTSHMGRTKATDVENYLGIKGEMVVYSDKHQAYVKFYKDRKIVNGVFKSSDHVSPEDKVVHNQTINYFSGWIKKVLNDDLRGVSTKYLQGYLNWLMFVQNAVKEKASTKEVVMGNKVALDVFKQKEREFRYFLRNNGRSNHGTCVDRYYAAA